MLGWTLSGMATENTQTGKTFFAKSSKEEFEQMCSLEVLGLKDSSAEEFHSDFMERLERLERWNIYDMTPMETECSISTNKQGLGFSKACKHSTKTAKTGEAGRIR